MKLGRFSAMMMGALLCASVSFAAEDVRLATVDLQKAIQSTTAGKKAKAELESEFNKKQKEIQKKEADLKKMQEDLEKRKLALTEEVLNKKQEEMQKEMLNYRQFVGESQNEIQKRERELTAPILQKMEKIIKKMAEEGGYTMILEKGSQGVIWAKKDVDLTDKLVAAFEKEK